MSGRIAFFIFSIFLFVQPLFGQEFKREDYVREFKNQFHLRAFTQYWPVSLSVEDKESDSQLLYRPNSAPYVGIGGNILNIGFALVFKLPESFALDQEKYGDSRFNNYQISFYKNHFAFDFHYHYHEGFYLDETKDLPESALAEISLRPDFDVEGGSLLGVYIFEPEEFTYRSYFNRVDKQLKSSGSFIGMVAAEHFILDSDSLLVPKRFAGRFTSSADLQEGRFSGFAIMPGYSHTFVVKEDFYLNLSLALGPDIQYKEYKTDVSQKEHWKLEGKINFRGGLGYDNDRFFAGLLYLNRQSNYSATGLNIGHTTSLIRFTVGHRFAETRWMKKLRESKLYNSFQNIIQ